MIKPSQKFIDFLKTQSIEEIAGTMIELQQQVDMLTLNHKPEPICKPSGTLPVYDSQIQTDPHHAAATKTLERLGYTYHGGELWKPPLGERPEWLDDPAPNQEPPTVIPLLSDYANKKLHKGEDGKWALVLGDDHIRHLSIFECNFVDSAIAVAHGIKENT